MQILRKYAGLLAITLFIMPYSLFPQNFNLPAEHYEPLSILISEVLYDPEPPVNLPGFEFIELYNRSLDTINFLNWTIRVGDKKIPLPRYLINPGEFAVLVNNAGAEDFMRLDINVIALSKWAALTNSGQDIILLSPGGEIIHFMSYHPSQFTDALKRDGGWSLELADQDNPCNTGSWLPSADPSGGTPGRKSSSKTRNTINKSPVPLRAGVTNDQELMIILDEPVLPITLPDWFSFNIYPSSLRVESWTYLDDNPTKLGIYLNDTIPDGIIFSLDIGGEAGSCSGVALKSTSLEFGIPQKPLPGDVVISEILFDPAEDEAEFIGIHNLSDKVLALNQLYLAVCDDDGVVNRFSKPDESSFLIFPGREYVLTGDGYLVANMSDLIPKGQISERTDMLSLSNEGSIICLLDENQELLDKVRYQADWHNPNLDKTKGISLERIRLDQDGFFSSNWHSASAFSGGSTPGIPNSQAYITEITDDVFSLENRAFCPNLDGSSDFLLINVSAPEPGWIGTAGIWSISGNRIKELSVPGTLPTRGSIKWDGSDDYGNSVPAGYYIIIINFIRQDGTKGRWKEACLVIAY